MNDEIIHLPGGAIVLASDVLVTRWHETPEKIAVIKLSGGKEITLKGDRAEAAMDVIKRAHDIKSRPETPSV